MHYLTCAMISSVDLACYGLSRSKDWVSVDCGTSSHKGNSLYFVFLIGVPDSFYIYQL